MPKISRNPEGDFLANFTLEYGNMSAAGGFNVAGLNESLRKTQPETVRPESVISLLSPDSTKNQAESDSSIKSVVIIARYPGPANYFVPIIHDFLKRGITVYLHAKDSAESIFQAQFPQKSIVKEVPEEAEINWLLLSSTNFLEEEFEIPVLNEIKLKHPKAKLSVCEDYPNSIQTLLHTLIQEHQIVPDSVLACTKRYAEIYRQQSPQIPTQRVQAVGQPAFDQLRDKNMKEISQNVRRELNIPFSSIMVTYAATPALEVYTPEGETSLNIFVLDEIIDTLIKLAKKYADKQFYFVNKPHPREKDFLWTYLGTVSENIPDNLHLMAYERNDWDNLRERGVDTNTLCTASQITITINSTVGQQVTIQSAQSDEPTSSVIHFLPTPPHTTEIITEALYKPIREIVESEASPLVRNGVQLLAQIEALLDPNVRAEIYKKQIKYADQYGINEGPAVPKIFEYLNTISSQDKTS